MPELSPAQLDQLEDALEELELGTGVPELDPMVQARLGEYQQVLSLCRDAMPLAEVRPGLLDGVMAEARASAPVAATAAETETAEPWWKRFRLSVWVPALAVAGSAALVLLLVRPAEQSDAAAPAAEMVARADDAPAAAQKSKSTPAAPVEIASEAASEALRDGLADASVEQPRRGRLRFGNEDEEERGAAAKAQAGAEPAPEPEPEPEAKDEADRDEQLNGLGGRGKIGGKKSGGSSSKGSAGPSPAKPPASTSTPKPNARPSAPATPGGGAAPVSPAPAPADKGPDGMGTILVGDKFRAKGDCGKARKEYAAVRKDPSAEVRGRALAGLGLCELVAGNTDSAESLFRQARLASSKVGPFITRERKSAERDQAQADEVQQDQAEVQKLPNQAL